MRKNEIFHLLLIGIVSLGVATAGFFTGKYLTLRNLRKDMKLVYRSWALGDLVPRRSLEILSPAYGDKALFLSKVKEIIWSPKNVPAPFVNNCPAPGPQMNAPINSLQLRSHRELTLPKPPGVYRIFLTGGSVAFGCGALSHGHIISEYLETLLNSSPGRPPETTYEVFTAANPAWASTHERIFIENRLSEWQPDLVISFSGNNDVHWGFYGENVLWFWNYADRYFFSCLTKYFNWGNNHLQDVTVKDPGQVHPELVAARLAKNIRLSAECLKIAGSRYLFVLQPNYWLIRKPFSFIEKSIIPEDREKERYFINCYSKIDQTLKKLPVTDLQYINFTDVFDGIPENETIFIDHYHFVDKGNEIVAKTLFNNIKGIVFVK
jgi:hypothetical protein